MFDKCSNGILITPSIIKEKVLKIISNKLLNIKIMTREEYLNNMVFSYNEKTILYLMNKYHYNYNITLKILNNLYFVDKNYNNDILDNLYKIREELLANNLLITNSSFKEFIKDKKIYIFGYDYIDNYFKKYLSNYEIIEISRIDKNLEVHAFKTLKEEVEFVLYNIASLVDKGINPKNIYLVNVGSEYEHILEQLSSKFNILLDKKINIYATIEVSNFLKYLKETKSFSLALEQIKDKEIYDVLLNISNKYHLYPYSDNLYELVVEEIKKTCININYQNSINLTTLENNYFDDQDYVFLVGFNQNIVPHLYKDEDYISDTLKNKIDLEDTNVKNKNAKESVIKSLYSIKNLVITYKLEHLGVAYYPSNLISELNMQVITNHEYKISYSKIYDREKLTSYLDDYMKYGIKNKNLEKYYYTYDIPYLKYDNNYKQVDLSLLYQKLNNHLNLSYSSIDTYYKCAFRYYLDNVLRIKPYEETFSLLIGNLYHHILSKVFLPDFNFLEEWDNYLKDKEIDAKERLLLSKLKEELIFIVKFVLQLKQDTGLTHELLEYKINIGKSTNIPVNFTGIIDKLMYSVKDDKTYITLVDYKTGNPDIKLNNIIHGMDMQLPIYWYLVKHGDFMNPTFVGMYLQKILNNPSLKNGKTLEEQKLDNLKLVGYSSSEQDRIARFDPTYENSTYIKGMKVKKDGTYGAFVKYLTDENLDKLSNIVDKNIDSARDNILNGEFSINPKFIDDELKGCMFCKYKDICFKTNKNINYLKTFKLDDILGGDNNA